MKKHLRRCAFALSLVLSMGSGCRPRSGLKDAGVALPAPSHDAGPSLILLLRLEVPLTDGGLFSAPLEVTGSTLLPLTQEMDLTANLPLRNYRVRIFDEIDRALASDDTPDELATGVRYHIRLLSPLRAGHRYTVLLDAQTGVTFDDGRGTALGEQRFEVRTIGEREKDAPVKRSQTKRHHRGT